MHVAHEFSRHETATAGVPMEPQKTHAGVDTQAAYKLNPEVAANNDM